MEYVLVFVFDLVATLVTVDRVGARLVTHFVGNSNRSALAAAIAEVEKTATGLQETLSAVTVVLDDSGERRETVEVAPRTAGSVVQA